MAAPPTKHYYELLHVPRTVSSANTKAPYRRLLPRYPDKFYPSKENSTQADVEIVSLRKAFTTLPSPKSRVRYDLDSSFPLIESSRSSSVHVVLSNFQHQDRLESFKADAARCKHHCSHRSPYLAAQSSQSVRVTTLATFPVNSMTRSTDGGMKTRAEPSWRCPGMACPLSWRLEACSKRSPFPILRSTQDRFSLDPFRTVVQGLSI